MEAVVGARDGVGVEVWEGVLEDVDGAPVGVIVVDRVLVGVVAGSGVVALGLLVRGVPSGAMVTTTAGGGRTHR